MCHLRYFKCHGTLTRRTPSGAGRVCHHGVASADLPDAAGLGQVLDRCEALDLPSLLSQPGFEVLLLDRVAFRQQASVSEGEDRRDRRLRVRPPLARLGQLRPELRDVAPSGRGSDGYPASHVASLATRHSVSVPAPVSRGPCRGYALFGGTKGYGT